MLEGRRGRIGYILRNCRDYGRDVSFFGNVLREGRRRGGEKKVARYVRPFSGAPWAPMSPGYVPWYTERSLSRRCISRDAARPVHLTYKMVSVFQLSRDKLWIMGVNTKQPIDYNVFPLQGLRERYLRFLLRHFRISRETKCQVLSAISSKARTDKLHLFA